MSLPVDVYFVPYDAPLWERREWDTDASWSYFSLYYFVQSPPRSALIAYETKTGKKKRGKGGKPPSIPSNWRRYAGGYKLVKGKEVRMRYQYIVEETHQEYGKVYPVPTWNQRARAWDANLLKTRNQQIRQSLIDDATVVARTTREAIKMLLRGQFLAIQQYTPTGKESLSELTRSMTNLLDMVREVYGVFPDDMIGELSKHEHSSIAMMSGESGESGGEDDGEKRLGMAERVEAISRIVAMAQARAKQDDAT